MATQATLLQRVLVWTGLALFITVFVISLLDHLRDILGVSSQGQPSSALILPLLGIGVFIRLVAMLLKWNSPPVSNSALRRVGLAMITVMILLFAYSLAIWWQFDSLKALSILWMTFALQNGWSIAELGIKWGVIPLFKNTNTPASQP